MKATTSRTANFGPYTLDLRSGEMRKFGTKIKMGEQSFRILCMLLETPGEMVTREELRAKLWSKSTNVSSDRKSTRLNSSHANISYAVFCLKKKKSLHG